MIKLTDTVKHLIIINVLLFVATLIFKDAIYDLLAMHYPANSLFKPWQIITHMFMHGNFDGAGNISLTHILFNMFGLWMFGSTVEQILGRNNFLILYFVAGIGAVLFSLGIDYLQFTSIYNELIAIGVTPNEIQHMLATKSIPNNDALQVLGMDKLVTFYSKYNVRMVGASGALYGVMVAFGVLMPKSKMGLLFLPIMIEARIFIPLMLLGDIFFGFLGGTNIGHFAHIGGAIFGFLTIWYLKNKQFRR